MFAEPAADFHGSECRTDGGELILLSGKNADVLDIRSMV